MKFNRGKTLSDPIYLRKDKNEIWLEGDIYEQFCLCMDQIFGGRKKYFVNSFSPKMNDIFSDRVFNKICVTDSDGDDHTFIGVVVDRDEFDRSQRGSTFRSEARVENKEAVAQDSGKKDAEKDSKDNTVMGMPIDEIYNSVDVDGVYVHDGDVIDGEIPQNDIKDEINSEIMNAELYSEGYLENEKNEKSEKDQLTDEGKNEKIAADKAKKPSRRRAKKSE